MSIGASCGRATNPPNGIDPKRILDTVDRFLPNRFAEPDTELLDKQPTPACGQKMAQLVHDDEQIEEDKDLEEDENDANNVE